MKKFKDEWVLAEVLKEDDKHEIIDVEPLAHSKNRDEAYDALKFVKKGQHVMTLYTGKRPKNVAYVL